MLKIYENGAVKYPLSIGAPDWYIEHKYEGDDVLKFEIPDTHEAYKHLAEEVRITDGANRYAVKKIDEHGGYVNVECALDLDDWRASFWRSFRTTNNTLQQVFDKIKPSGWVLTGAEGITQRATIEASEGKGLENVTAESVLSKAAEVYEVVFNFNVPGKAVRVIDPAKYVPSGDYVTDELNLKSVGFVGNSSDFATRLYAYGKKDSDGNPVTISSVNGGKEYIDNHQYSDRIISVGWSDERYTVPANLLSAAKKKLDELSYPVRSYECDVRNFDENMYMYKVVTLVDRKRKTRVEHRVITFKEYPEAHHNDVITLSAVPPKIESSMKSIRAEINEKVSVAQQVSSDAVLEAISVVTGKNGGHVKIDMVDGNPEVLRVQHSDGTETVMGENGVSRGGIPYQYGLALNGAVDIDIETGRGVVQLPSLFSDMDIDILLGVQSIESVGESDVVQSIENSWEYDQEANTLTVISDCKMYNIIESAPATAKSIKISYFITGR